MSKSTNKAEVHVHEASPSGILGPMGPLEASSSECFTLPLSPSMNDNTYPGIHAKTHTHPTSVTSLTHSGLRLTPPPCHSHIHLPEKSHACDVLAPISTAGRHFLTSEISNYSLLSIHIPCPWAPAGLQLDYDFFCVWSLPVFCSLSPLNLHVFTFWPVSRLGLEQMPAPFESISECPVLPPKR